MNIAFIYGPFSLGNRPINFSNLNTSSRGLTGSELGCIEYARAMKNRGHEATLYIPNTSSFDLDGVTVRNYDDLPNNADKHQVYYAWNEPDTLKCVDPSKLRMVNQQINDFSYCGPGFDEFVDIYTSPSQAHMEFIRQHTPSPDKWRVMPNGCDPSQYDLNAKVPGRVIYASSPDRGLHLLLQAWPSIKRSVPHAELRVFYNMDDWLARFLPVENHHIVDFVELGRRARYISLALKRMASHGIVKVGSVSREQIAREMSQAEVLAYPCDTVRFTESFSITIMEACASGTVPIISSVDALGQIYGDHIPTIPAPVRDKIHEFSDLVIRGLTDSNFQREVRDKATELARNHAWPILAQQLEKLMEDNL